MSNGAVVQRVGQGNKTQDALPTNQAGEVRTAIAAGDAADNDGYYACRIVCIC